MKLVIGLGNPGGEYHCTRHNAGFWVVDCFLARRRKKATKRDHMAFCATWENRGESVCFAKPQTFMNSSGRSVARLVRAMDARAEDVLVVHDEADIEPGRMKLTKGGGGGGHNGLQSIFDWWDDPGFYRLRMGVGKDPAGRELADYVLQAVPESFMSALGESGADALERIFNQGPQKAMNEINRNPLQEP